MQHRTDWHDAVLTAFAEDLGWPVDDRGRQSPSAALDDVANDPSRTRRTSSWSRQSFSRKIQTFPQGWRYNSHIGTEADGQVLPHLRARKALETTPPVHVVGAGFASRGTREDAGRQPVVRRLPPCVARVDPVRDG